jgi:hypothetical protein
MNRENERGVALIVVLMAMGILSIMAASMVLVAQTETFSSQNYRLMSQARYGAESAVHRATNYLMHTYAAPTGAGLAAFTTTVSPVTCASGCTGTVVLSSVPAVTGNYPDGSVQTAFSGASSGTLAGGTNPVGYGATATLISMRQMTPYGMTLPAAVPTWQIVGIGVIGGARPAQVDVAAVLERQTQPVFSYAAFATDNGCGALSWSGGGSTDSYDSSAPLVGGVPVTDPSGGNVGTNGNLDENGGVTVINGSLSTPRTGIGGCASGAVTALTLSGSPAPTAGLTELAQTVNYPPPDPPNPPPTGDFTVNNSTTVSKVPGSYGNIVIKGELRLTAGIYNINSLSMNAGAVLRIMSGPVILNVAGYNTAGDPSSGYLGDAMDMTGGSMSTNGNYDPSLFQILYAGTGNIKMAGGSDTVCTLYAPNATVMNNSAGANWYGAVVARRVTDSGHATIHYDRRLSTYAETLGPFMLDSFTWRKF